MALFLFIYKIKTKMEYNIIIRIKDSDVDIIKTVKYDTEYQLKTDVITIGNNGYLHKNDDNNYIYYPSHKIDKIEVEKLID